MSARDCVAQIHSSSLTLEVYLKCGQVCCMRERERERERECVCVFSMCVYYVCMYVSYVCMYDLSDPHIHAVDFIKLDGAAGVLRGECGECSFGVERTLAAPEACESECRCKPAHTECCQRCRTRAIDTGLRLLCCSAHFTGRCAPGRGTCMQVGTLSGHWMGAVEALTAAALTDNKRQSPSLSRPRYNCWGRWTRVGGGHAQRRGHRAQRHKGARPCQQHECRSPALEPSCHRGTRLANLAPSRPLC